jgi:DNA-binding transcriptional ArsR family regulator
MLRRTLRAVAECPRGATEVAVEVGLSVATATHHLGVLLDAGMVRGRRAGRREREVLRGHVRAIPPACLKEIECQLAYLAAREVIGGGDVR